MHTFFCRRIPFMMNDLDLRNERLFKYETFIEDIKFPTASFIREIEKFFAPSRNFLLPEEFHILALCVSRQRRRKVFKLILQHQKSTETHRYPKNYIRHCVVVSGEVEAGWPGRRLWLVLEELRPGKHSSMINQVAEGVIDLRKKLIYLLN